MSISVTASFTNFSGGGGGGDSKVPLNLEGQWINMQDKYRSLPGKHSLPWMYPCILPYWAFTWHTGRV